jgi:DNA-binding GntR family transcriptional regulator
MTRPMTRDAPALTPMHLPPLPEQVADRIVGAMADGRIGSGTRLVEAELALALGVSRVPLREAFRILHSQGLLAITPRRGTRAIDFDEAWARDLRQVRCGVERVTAAGAALALRRDAAARAALDARIEGIRRALAQGDLLSVNEADIAFHDCLADLTGSPLLTTIWRALRRHVLVLFSIDVRKITRPERILDDHLRLSEALLAAPPEILDAAIRAHVLWQDAEAGTRG